jgi:transposase
MGQKMKCYKRVIGIDISTERLDIADSQLGIDREVEYSVEAILSKITKSIKEPAETLVVCEATGGLEYVLVDALHDAKIDVVVANPARVRDFAKGHGYFEKSDKIDARMLQLYGQQVEVSLAKPRTVEERHFIALSRRRTQLLPGVGMMMTSTLVAELPELGSLSRAKIAKLVGVAPMIRQSGKSDFKRRARGGRGNVRRVLYMAARPALGKLDGGAKVDPRTALSYIRTVGFGENCWGTVQSCLINPSKALPSPSLGHAANPSTSLSNRFSLCSVCCQFDSKKASASLWFSLAQAPPSRPIPQTHPGLAT